LDVQMFFISEYVLQRNKNKHKHDFILRALYNPITYDNKSIYICAETIIGN